MLQKFLPLIGALLVAGPASAISVNMSDFSFGSPVSVDMQGTDGSPSYEGVAGRFDGGIVGEQATTAKLRLAAAQAAPDSFVAWCAELTQTFSFGVTYEYEEVAGVSYFGATKTADLSRLFTAAQGFVVDRFTSAAMQAGIWEIIYEHGPSFSLTGGTFKGAPEEAAGQGAFDVVNGFLANLGAYRRRCAHRRPPERRAPGLPGRDDSRAGDLDAARPGSRRRRPAETASPDLTRSARPRARSSPSALLPARRGLR